MNHALSLHIDLTRIKHLISLLFDAAAEPTPTDTLAGAELPGLGNCISAYNSCTEILNHRIQQRCSEVTAFCEHSQHLLNQAEENDQKLAAQLDRLGEDH